jgi:transcriptional repressor NF-X1
MDPVPTCTSICMRPLEGCEHVCSSPCHTGPCPPCSIMLVRPCRCGAITRNVRCSQANSPSAGDILCDRPCGALRACGRHRCGRVCCPLAALATPAGKGKGKKRATASELPSELADDSGLHECDLVCGKPLACGNHRCEERDHRGACPPCLRSSFDEVGSTSAFRMWS